MTVSADRITRREALERMLLLVGGTLSAPTLSALLTACEGGGGEQAATQTEFTSVLTSEQRELLATMAEHVIPQTDTPGARAVGVHDFVDEMMSVYYPPEERDIFMTGLANVDERARQAHNQRFLDCTPEQQVAILTALDRETLEAPPPPEEEAPTQEEIREQAQPGTRASPLPPEVAEDSIAWALHMPEPQRSEAPFWRTMKELTLVGYYTSEPGATQELRHEPVPGRYEGCVPYAQIGRTWAV